MSLQMIKPGMPRARIIDDAAGKRVVIPARRNWLTVAILPFWLGFWLFGLGMVLYWLLFLPGGRTGVPFVFMIVWLAGWTIGGGHAWFVWLWNLAGREVLLLTGTSLTHRFELLGLARTRRFDPASIHDVRAVAAPVDPWSPWSRSRGLGMGEGSIAFDYGAKTYRVAGGLDEAEAKQIVALIRAHYGPTVGGGAP